MSPMEELYNSTCLHQKTRKSTAKGPNDATQKVGKQEQIKSQHSQQQEVLKIRAEIN